MTVSVNTVSTQLKPSHDVPPATQSPAIMVAMVKMLSEVQVSLANSFARKSDMDQEIAEAQVKAMDDNYKDVLKKIEKMQEQEAHRSFWQKFTKGFEIAAMVVGGAIALSSGFGSALAFGLTTAIVAIAESPAMDAVKAGISDMFQDMGMSKEAADAVTSVVVTVAIIAVCVASGKAASSVASRATSAASEFTSLSTKSMAIVAGAQMVMSENLAAKIVEALPIQNKTAKEVLEITAMITQTIACVVAMVKGAPMGGTANVGGMLSKLPSMTSLIKGEIALQGLGLIPQGFTAYTYGEQAHLLDGLADDTQAGDLIRDRMSMLSASGRRDQGFVKGMVQGFDQENERSGSNLFLGQAAEAEVLAHRAV